MPRNDEDDDHDTRDTESEEEVENSTNDSDGSDDDEEGTDRDDDGMGKDDEFEDEHDGKGGTDDDDDEFDADDDDDHDDEKAAFSDDPEHRRESEEESRPRIALLILCCCCLLLIVLAIGLGLGLTRNKDISTLSPTPAPTPTANDMTTAPAPTSDTVPPKAVEEPSADTDSFGNEDTMLVQKGGGDPELPDSYGVMNFNWNETGHPWYNEEDLEGYNLTSELCLKHVPEENPQDPNRSFKYSLCRLPSSNKNIDAVNGGETNYTMPGDCLGDGDMVNFTVTPTDSDVCVDVTSLLGAYQPFTSAPPVDRRNRRTVRRRRNLEPNSFENILFMVANVVDGQIGSDSFYTRESEGNSPKLTLKLELQDDNVVAPPSPSAAPTTMEPTASAEPTSPTMSPAPTSEPSAAIDDPNVPPPVQEEDAPTGSPTGSPGPTTSFSPTYEALHPPCGLCGVEEYDVPLNPYPVAIPEYMTPPQVDGNATCIELQDLCERGYCQPMLCEVLPTIAEFCGCNASITEAPEPAENPPCGICGDGKEVTLPKGMVEMPSDLGGASEAVSCADADAACQAGFCEPQVCVDLPLVVADICGCAASSTPDDPAQMQPACNVCGEGSAVTLLDGMVALGDMAIPGFNETLSCNELQDLCNSGFCGPGRCVEYPSLTMEACGCKAAGTTAPNATQAPTQPTQGGTNVPCGVCGMDPAGVTLKNFTVEIPIDVAPPGVVNGTSTCVEMEALCLQGYCVEALCMELPRAVGEFCGCPMVV